MLPIQNPLYETNIELANDSLLRTLSDSFKGQSVPYFEIISRYFEKIHETNSLLPKDKKYQFVLEAITKLWEDSQKNPSIFKSAKDFEPVLQRIHGYRDHFIHSFNTFVIGHYILNKLYEIDPENCFKQNSNHPNLTWMLASTFHDVAYPLQEMEEWTNDICKTFLGINPMLSMGINEIVPPIYIDFMRMICQEHRQPRSAHQSVSFASLDWSFYSEINQKFVAKDHGVLGGIILAHLLAVRSGFAEGDRKWDFLLDHLPACHAIILHTMTEKINFSRHPFAFLLALCDEIQDVGRPSRLEKQDNLLILDLNIQKVNVPEICFKVQVSDKRRALIAGNLSKNRLSTSGKIKIVFQDGSGNELYSL